MNYFKNKALVALSMITIGLVSFETSCSAVVTTDGFFEHSFVKAGYEKVAAIPTIQKIEIVAGVSLLWFVIESFHRLYSKDTDYDLHAERFADDVSAAFDALVHGRIKEFRHKAYVIWDKYIVGRKKKAVDIEVGRLEADGSVKIVKDKELRYTAFGLLGKTDEFCGSLKDLAERLESFWKVMPAIGISYLVMKVK